LAVLAGRGRIVLAAGGARRSARRSRARGGRRGDRHGLDGGVELEFPACEILEGVFVLEEHDLAERLTAGLQADADLVHLHVADVLALLVGAPAAMRSPDTGATLADGREY